MSRLKSGIRNLVKYWTLGFSLVRNNLLLLIWILIIAIFTPAYADVMDNMRMEADYILACQFNPSNPSNPHYGSRGAINDITGNPTWVVPRGNGMAILGLVTASEVLDEPLYMDRANLI